MTDSNEINRRDALKVGLLGAAAAGIATQAAQPARAQSPKANSSRPNILLLLVDEQRYPMVYESEQLRSFRETYLPAQNSLAARGIAFDRHYIAFFYFVPSRT